MNPLTVPRDDLECTFRTPPHAVHLVPDRSGQFIFALVAHCVDFISGGTYGARDSLELSYKYRVPL